LNPVIPALDETGTPDFCKATLTTYRTRILTSGLIDQAVSANCPEQFFVRPRIATRIVSHSVLEAGFIAITRLIQQAGVTKEPGHLSLGFVPHLNLPDSSTGSPHH